MTKTIKLSSLLLSLIIVLTLASCNENTANKTTTISTSTEVTTEVLTTAEPTTEIFKYSNYINSIQNITSGIISLYNKEGNINFDNWDDYSTADMTLKKHAGAGYVLTYNEKTFYLKFRYNCIMITAEHGKINKVILQSSYNDYLSPFSEDKIDKILEIIFPNCPKEHKVNWKYIWNNYLSNARGDSADWTDSGYKFTFILKDNKQDLCLIFGK